MNTVACYFDGRMEFKNSKDLDDEHKIVKHYTDKFLIEMYGQPLDVAAKVVVSMTSCLANYVKSNATANDKEKMPYDFLCFVAEGVIRYMDELYPDRVKKREKQ